MRRQGALKSNEMKKARFTSFYREEINDEFSFAWPVSNQTPLAPREVPQNINSELIAEQTINRWKRCLYNRGAGRRVNHRHNQNLKQLDQLTATNLDYGAKNQLQEEEKHIEVPTGNRDGISIQYQANLQPEGRASDLHAPIRNAIDHSPSHQILG